MSATLFIAVILVSVIAIVATVIAVARDGYRPARTDRSRLPAPDVAAAIVDATARPYSSAIPAEPAPALPQRAPAPAQPEPAHTAIRRAARVRGPRRAASAPKSPR